MNRKYTVAVHGGAGTIPVSTMTGEKKAAYTLALQEAVRAATLVLEKGGAALDAVEQAVISLENFPLFNAGRGSVFTNKGIHEMDASIMDGRTLEAGAVAGVKGIRNPVTLARAVKEKSGHVFLCGQGAEEFAKAIKLPFEDAQYFFTEERHQQWLQLKDTDAYELDHAQSEPDEKKFGTVGAVAMDRDGNLAAATSTGGMTNKRFGRVGDTPMIGAGTYANNNTCAVSCTGHGEFFIRAVVAYDVSCLMEYKGLSLKEACDIVVKNKLLKMGGEGGLIAVDRLGNIELCYNSEGMYRAWMKEGEEIEAKIYL